MNLSKTNILTTLAENVNESLLELAYFCAESAVKHKSIERAEWGDLAGWLVPCHMRMLPILPARFVPARTLTNVSGYWDQTARHLFVRGPLMIHLRSRRPLHSSNGWINISDICFTRERVKQSNRKNEREWQKGIAWMWQLDTTSHKKLLQNECQTILAEGQRSKLPKVGTDMATDKTLYFCFCISLFIILLFHSMIIWHIFYCILTQCWALRLALRIEEKIRQRKFLPLQVLYTT